jgi:hypothetical protein
MTSGKHVQRAHPKLRNIFYACQRAVGERSHQIPHAGHQPLWIVDHGLTRPTTVPASAEEGHQRKPGCRQERP